MAAGMRFMNVLSRENSLKRHTTPSGEDRAAWGPRGKGTHPRDLSTLTPADEQRVVWGPRLVRQSLRFLWTRSR